MTKLSLTAEWKELYLSTDTAKMQFVANREVLKCFHHVANWCRPTNDTDLSMKLQKTLSDLDSLILTASVDKRGNKEFHPTKEVDPYVLACAKFIAVLPTLFVGLTKYKQEQWKKMFGVLKFSVGMDGHQAMRSEVLMTTWKSLNSTVTTADLKEQFKEYASTDLKEQFKEYASTDEFLSMFTVNTTIIVAGLGKNPIHVKKTTLDNLSDTEQQCILSDKAMQPILKQMEKKFITTKIQDSVKQKQQAQLEKTKEAAKVLAASLGLTIDQLKSML